MSPCLRCCPDPKPPLYLTWTLHSLVSGLTGLLVSFLALSNALFCSQIVEFSSGHVIPSRGLSLRIEENPDFLPEYTCPIWLRPTGLSNLPSRESVSPVWLASSRCLWTHGLLSDTGFYTHCSSHLEWPPHSFPEPLCLALSDHLNSEIPSAWPHPSHIPSHSSFYFSLKTSDYLKSKFVFILVCYFIPLPHFTHTNSGGQRFRSIFSPLHL